VTATLRPAIFAAYLVAAAGTIWTIVMSRWGGRPDLLVTLTAESGPFEAATALSLFLLGLWAATRGAWGWRLLGVLLVVAALEELSWGQHLLGFETPGWLRGRNYQGEANLHNLVDSEVFSALLLVPIHLGFVVVPLVVALWPQWRRRGPLARVSDGVWPRPHTSLMFCFGWGLHAWGVPAAAADSAGLVVVLIVAGAACGRAEAWRQRSVVTHWLCVSAATALFASAAGIYRYYNTQYEIRELFVVLGLAHWLTGWGPGRGTTAGEERGWI
jgi:hypothetical protein